MEIPVIPIFSIFLCHPKDIIFPMGVVKQGPCKFWATRYIGTFIYINQTDRAMVIYLYEHSTCTVHQLKWRERTARTQLCTNAPPPPVSAWFFKVLQGVSTFLDFSRRRQRPQKPTWKAHKTPKSENSKIKGVPTGAVAPVAPSKGRPWFSLANLTLFRVRHICNGWEVLHEQDH